MYKKKHFIRSQCGEGNGKKANKIYKYKNIENVKIFQSLLFILTLM